MEYEIGDRVYVKESDAAEFRAEIIDITETHFQIITREDRKLWVQRRNCSRWSRQR